MKVIRHTAPELEVNDILVKFDDSNREEQPLCQAQVQTEDGLKELHISAVSLGRELRMSFQPDRCSEEALFRRPLDQREEELEAYRNRTGLFRRCANPDSNFYQAGFSGPGRLAVSNRGQRALRFQLEGRLYRVAAGSTELLIPSNPWARIQPPSILLDAGGVLDHGIAAVHVRENGVWKRGGVSFCCGDGVDSYHLRVGQGGEWLGVLEAHSSYFLYGPRLELLDLELGGPALWYLRNAGTEALPVQTPDGRLLALPPDRRAYRLMPAGERMGKETVQ